MQPKISLLMANYNNGKYIKKAIKSVLNQSDPRWELIIVDDASTDDSLKIIRSYLKDKRVKLIKHVFNKGYGATLHSAIKNSSAKIIGRIDSDDVLHKDAVKIMIKEHEKNPNIGLIYSTHYECDENLKIKNIAKWVKQPKISCLHNPTVSHFATFKKSAYDKTKGFDPELKKAVDKDIYYKLEEVTKLKFISKPLYYYRIHENGISQGNQLFKARIYDLFVKYRTYKRRLNTNSPNLTRKEMSDLFFEVGYRYLKQNNLKKTKLFLLKSIKLNPLNLNYIKTYIKRIILKLPISCLY